MNESLQLRRVSYLEQCDLDYKTEWAGQRCIQNKRLGAVDLKKLEKKLE